MSDPTPYVVVEKPTRLSESLLWSIQVSYFQDRGLNAWGSGEVPYLVTTSPLVADAYAKMLHGFMLDCVDGCYGPYDSTEPIYLIELGAGSGRLAFNTVSSLLELVKQDGHKFVYVMTDLASANIEAWQRHPGLAKFIQQDLIDFARFDAVSGTEISLELSGKKLSRGTVVNPLGALATYLFDVIPQDLYVASNGLSYEELIALIAPDGHLDTGTVEFFRQLRLVPVRVDPGTDRYLDDDLDTVLAQTRQKYENGTWKHDRRFLFPSGALRVVKTLVNISEKRLVLLLGERADKLPVLAVPEDSTGVADPDLAVQLGLDPSTRLYIYRSVQLLGMGIHGASFSLPVELEILASLLQLWSAILLTPSTPLSRISIAAAVVGAQKPSSHLTNAFNITVEEFQASEMLFEVPSLSIEDKMRLSLDVLMRLITMSHYDLYLIPTLRSAITARLAGASPQQVAHAVTILKRAANNYYCLPVVPGSTPGTNYPFIFATLFSVAGAFPEALEYVAKSESDFGLNPATCLLAASAHLALGKYELALTKAKMALELNPNFAPARQFIQELDQLSPDSRE